MNYEDLMLDEEQDVDPALLKARMSRDENVALANLFQGVSQIGAGLAGRKADTSAFDAARSAAQKEAEESFRDVTLKRKAISEAIAQRKADDRLAQQERLTLERLDRADANTDKRLAIMERIAAAKAGEKPSIGQQAIDREYGKKFAQRVSEGGYADAEKGVSQIDDAIGQLGKTDSATGPLVGLLPKGVRDIVTPSGAAIQDSIEEVVQRNLRQVLGAQFTQEEGKRLIERAYNPRLSEAENVKRLKRLQMQMQKALQSQKAADEYFQTHGTMEGFTGKTYASADDFNLDSDVAAPSKPSSGLSAEQRRKRIQELRAKLGR